MTSVPDHIPLAGMVDKMVKLAEANPPQPMPGPTREELLKLIAAPTGA